MHAARLALVVLLLLAIVVAYSPQARGQAVKAWEKVKPAVVGITDNLYVAIRNLIVSNPPRDKLNDRPTPRPGMNFLRIVTLNTNTVL